MIKLYKDLTQEVYFYDNSTLIRKQDRYHTIELSYEECLNIYPEYGTMSWKDLTEVQAVLNSRMYGEDDARAWARMVIELAS